MKKIIRLFQSMAFMLVATITSLCQTIIAKFSAGGDMWNYIQGGIACLLVVLAVILAMVAFKTLAAQKNK